MHTHKVLHATDPKLKIFTSQPPEKLAGITLIENIISGSLNPTIKM